MDDRRITETTWVLERLCDDDGTLGAALPESRATLEFAEGRIGGSASCNRFSTSGPLTEIPDMIALTMMMCPEPLMDQERRYLALLPRISDVRLEGDLLIAADDEGTDILVWRAEPDADDV
jgi:heat shock protein HslJ